MTTRLHFCPLHTEPTPTLPGYCSVWSCDEELAELMLERVKRGPYALSDVQNYNDMEEYND